MLPLLTAVVAQDAGPQAAVARVARRHPPLRCRRRGVSAWPVLAGLLGLLLGPLPSLHAQQLSGSGSAAPGSGSPPPPAAVVPAPSPTVPRNRAPGAVAAGAGLPGQPLVPSRDRLGVWFTTVDSRVLREQAAAAQAIDDLSRHGFTRAAVPLYTGGTVTWPLRSSANPLGLPLDPELPSRDHLRQLLDQLGQRGLVRVGWMEFGLMAPVHAAWLVGRDELLLRDRQGSTLWAESPGLNRVWLNPALPQVQEALEALVLDACRTLPLEVIQFDDHLGYPSRFGYDAASLRLWRATPEGAADPLPAADAPAWLRWRADQVTALLTRLRGAMRRECPGVKLSAAPNPSEFSYRASLADWPTWIERDLVDELVVQIYRWDPQALGRELAEVGLNQARRRLPLRIGLLAGLRAQPKRPEQLRQELALVREQGFSGVDLFFYESLRPHLPLLP